MPLSSAAAVAARQRPQHRPNLRVVRDRPLRIADVALFYGERSGGIRTYLEAKAHFAARTGAFEHHLLVPGRRERHLGARHELPSLRLAAANGYRLPLGAGRLKATLRAVNPDVVMLHDPFWAPLGVTQVAHELGARVVAVHHGSAALDAAAWPGPQHVYRPLLRAWIRAASRPVDGVMSAVDPLADAGRSANFPLRFGLHPAFRPQPEVPRGEHTLYVGRIGREKGIFGMLEAASRSREPWPVTLIGSGPVADHVADHVRNLGLSSRVKILPYLADQTRLAREYAGAACVVMPGEYETFGLVALEAAACGARVVACENAPSAQSCGTLVTTFAPGDRQRLLAAMETARNAPRDLDAAATVAAANGWDAAFAAEISDLEALVR